jgi:murein DD-endopeptidase MepM/ murein hydrolase activator NlpD
MRRSESGRVLVLALLLIVLLALVGFLALAAFRAGPSPEISVKRPGSSIGKKTPVGVTVSEPVRGLSTVRVELVQGDRVERLAEKAYSPRSAWSFWGGKTDRDELALDVGRGAIKGLKAGKATLRVTAGRAPAWFRRPAPAVSETSFEVRLTPPSLGVTSTFHYARQGGAEVVTYRVGESSVRDGVRSGSLWFPGFPLPGAGKQDRFAFFALPHDLADPATVKLAAADDAGNEAEVAFLDQFAPRKPVEATMSLSDAFLNKVVSAILSGTPDLADRGGLLENFLAINRELRNTNAESLVELASRSRPEFLWSTTFLPMINAKVTAPFAERRTYVYQGRVVDHQVHLGFDLAATKAVQVPASNDGVVVLARFFGIYGNAVVVDHGYGLQSLYGHLSTIDVKEGQAVKRGEILGRTGDTGLAGGDHLHFSILLGGQPVNPQEWWDGHWIRDRIARKLGGALKFTE